jgi:cyclopropane-fatty-acyl-phospholipid synthase
MNATQPVNLERSPSPGQSHDPQHRSTSGAILELLAGPVAQRDFAVGWWDGSVDAPGASTARFTLVLNRPGALRRMLLPPTELNIAESFIRQDFDVEGDLEAALGLDASFRAAGSPANIARLVPMLRSLPTDDLPPDAVLERPRPGLSGHVHSKTQDATDVRSHYDLGNDFYALFLDSRMVYSCAYFETGAEDLDTAQAAKLELTCRKLRLRPGQRLLDIGCGWGGLVIHAAQHHGVHATGITLSERQAELARERVKQAGLEDLVKIEVCDYRDLKPGTRFHKIVSVGMVEHVGRPNIRAYFETAHQLLEPGGVFLCHGIVEARTTLPPVPRLIERLTWRRTSFLHHYIFPGGEVLYPSELLAAAEASGFEPRDLESLSEHYALTARHWWRRLEANREEAIKLVGEPTYRAYRLYLAAVIRTFKTRVNGLTQILLSKPMDGGSSGLPLTRTDWYTGESDSSRAS